jgi:hypothetical protein
LVYCTQKKFGLIGYVLLLTVLQLSNFAPYIFKSKYINKTILPNTKCANIRLKLQRYYSKWQIIAFVFVQKEGRVQEKRKIATINEHF